MIDTGVVKLLKVSATVIAIEYGSSPVDAALHQTRIGLRLPSFFRCSAKIGK